jgi:DNA modification methylase
MLDEVREADPQAGDDGDGCIPQVAALPVSAPGDLWQLGRHRLLCGDARDAEGFVRLMAGKSADLVFTDLLYNVKIDGHVCGLGGISSISAGRQDELAMHPTVKPVALVADAIRDCSKRGQVVLDCFGGSGSTLIAAEKTGRAARLIEYDPLYCDVIIRRGEHYTGKKAVHMASGESFETRSHMASEAEVSHG